MKRYVAFGLVAVLLVSAPGCGGPDSAMKAVISDMNALADAIEKKQPEDKIKAAADRLKASSEKLEKMKLSDAEKEKLVKKYEKELMESTMRLLSAGMSNPEAGKYIDEAMGAGKKSP